MLFWIFLVRCSSRSTVIFLIVRVKKSKSTIRENFTFFRKETFSNLAFSFIAEKKIAKKIKIFFSVHQNCKTKKFAISKISNEEFRKIHYFANIKYKINSRKYWEKNLRINSFVKRQICAKKFDKKIFTKKKFVEKNLFEIFYNNFGNFFIFEKNSVKIWLIFEKKRKNFENNFWKKIRLKCRLISVNQW